MELATYGLIFKQWLPLPYRPLATAGRSRGRIRFWNQLVLRRANSIRLDCKQHKTPYVSMFLLGDV